MSNYKKYKSTSGVEYNFYVNVGEEEKFVTLNGPGATLIVKDMKVANAIEKSNAFKNGKIKLDSVVGEELQEEAKSNVETKKYPDVKNMGDAVDLLTQEYDVDEADVAKKADVLKKAKELGVSLPNYK